jgi:hypothetical protein
MLYEDLVKTLLAGALKKLTLRFPRLESLNP